jgi:hypothetical protein
VATTLQPSLNFLLIFLLDLFAAYQDQAMEIEERMPNAARRRIITGLYPSRMCGLLSG